MGNFEYYYNSWVETFCKQQYKWLSRFASGRTLIDIGAQTGDSLFYFLEQGIKRAICYEPDNDAYIRLIQNIGFYHKDYPYGKISVICGEAASPFNNTITEAVIIKCDIEGAEHELFTQDSVFDHVKALQIEYHGGIKNLKKVFTDKNFNVLVDKPWTHDSILGEVGFMYVWER